MKHLLFREQILTLAARVLLSVKIQKYKNSKKTTKKKQKKKKKGKGVKEKNVLWDVTELQKQ